MRVCDIVQFHSPLSGGVKRYTDDKARYFESIAGVEHSVVIPSSRDAVTRTGVTTIHEVRSPSIPGPTSYRALIDRRRILEIATRERPDIIEVGDPYRSAWVAVEAAQELDLPIVTVYHSDYPRALGRTVTRIAGPWAGSLSSAVINTYLKRLYSHMDATIVTSSYTEGILSSLGIPNVVRIPLGVDTGVFRPRNARRQTLEELGVDPESRVMLYVGRLAREKKIGALLSAAEKVAADLPDTYFLIAGDGELRRTVAAAAGSRPHVIWLGHVSDSERLARLYSAADLLVHAGTDETFGLSCVEAQACGTRVLGVRTGGLADVADGEPHPVWADDATPDALARGVVSALDAPDGPHERLERSRRTRERFDWRTTYGALMEVYGHVLARHECLLLPQAVVA
jgi:alpha-1,6-mannosyltransferase